jgi:uncharacterized membrane protein YuzA (DUF378 family)
MRNPINIIAIILVIIGGINWGLIGFFDYNLVAEIFGAGDIISEIIYGLVGLAAVYLAVALPALWGSTSSSRLHTNL